MKHPYRRLLHPCFRSLIAVLVSLALPAAASAQNGYVFTKIIDNGTPRPDGQGNFYVGFPLCFPSLDGDKLIFQDTNNDTGYSYWSADAFGGGLVKLVDLNTAVPGGVGNFTRFDDQTARVKDGVVLFEGLDSNTTVRTHGGLYTVPAVGGTISKVIDYHSSAPESGFPFVQGNGNDQITDGPVKDDYDFENGVVAFHSITNGDTQGDNADGIYTVHLDGTSLTLLANRANDATPPPFVVNQYYSVALHGGTAVFYGATVFGGYGIFSSPATGGLGAPVGLATPNTPLPGGQSPETTTNYFFNGVHSNFDEFDHATGNLIFGAKDGSGLNGLYLLPANGLGSGVFTKVVDNKTALPGAAVPASSLDVSSFSTADGQVAFLTPNNESTGEVGAIYVANEADGTIARVIGIGDVLDGITLAGLTLGGHALSDGRIVFGAGSIFQGKDGNARYGAVFVATPMAQTADLALTQNRSATTVAAGQTFAYTVAVTNRGPAAAPAATVTDTLSAGVTFVSATDGATATGGVVTWHAGSLPVGASASVDISVQATAAGSLTNTATVADTVADADLSNNTAQSVVTAAEVPTVTIAVASEAVEGKEAGVAVVRRAGDTTGALTVRYKVKGAVKPGKDYVALSGKLVFAPGAAKAKIKLKPINDKKHEGTRVADIKLLPSANGAYVLGASTVAKIKIIDNDK